MAALDGIAALGFAFGALPKKKRTQVAMAGPLVVIIPHQLGKDEALRRLKPALSTASLNFPVLKVEEEVWFGERLDFRVRALGQVAAGNVQVGEGNVRVEVTLPWLLHKFGEVVQRTIQGRGRILLDKK
jgi:hypothetical protein